MRVIGLNQQEQDEIFRMLAIILWLGNVQFVENADGYAEISDNEGKENRPAECYPFLIPRLKTVPNYTTSYCNFTTSLSHCIHRLHHGGRCRDPDQDFDHSCR
jgi:hypothetical protein